MTFWIVSTNPADFDEMWWKINLLTTMIYPQYSAGTTVNLKDQGNITSPFSQIPTASPVIRIRLGDLLKSNYSKFALARLFGIGEKDNISDASWSVELDDLAGITENALDNALNERTAGIEPTIFGPPKIKFIVKKAVKASWMKDISTNWMGKPGKGKGAIKKYMTIPSGIVIEVNASTISLDSLATALKNGDIMGLAKYGGATFKAGDPSGMLPNPRGGWGITGEVRFQKWWAFTQRIERKGGKAAGDQEFEIPYETLFNSNFFEVAPGQDDIFGALYEEIAAPDTIGHEIMQAESGGVLINPIVKAFESTRGRGLAGVITQLDFAWLDQTTWTTGVPGSRAPKACKVTLSFSPMHDIAPGIDHHGMNRAPIYNVGTTANIHGGDPYDGDED
jgi:hypothetical protein